MKGRVETHEAEVQAEVIDRAVMENRAIGEEENGIKEVDDSEAWLVDAEDDGFGCGHGGFEHFDDLESGGTVEAGGGFVEEEEFGVVDDLDADGDAAALSAGDAAEAVVAEGGVGDVGEAEVVDEGGDLGGEGRRREAEAEAGGEGEGFGDGEEREEGVVVGDVGGGFGEVGGAEGAAVDEDGTAVGGDFAGEDLEEGGLSGAAGADDGQDLAGFGPAIDVAEDVAVVLVVGM